MAGHRSAEDTKVLGSVTSTVYFGYDEGHYDVDTSCEINCLLLTCFAFPITDT